jgi:catechol 2,3-dioxygenase-like lactoylglutathione lyase family enzyme
MLKDVPLTGIFVDDQEAALDFYTGKLGLEKVQDEPYGEGAPGLPSPPRR